MSNTNNNDVLTEPPVVSSTEDGFLNITLSLEETLVEINDKLTIRTRAYNGTIPGPTLRVKPGDTLNIRFLNLLQDQGVPYRHNTISAPDESNLHFHGLYVSGELPSDDTTVVVKANGDSFEYTTTIPSVHHPGTHWIHPHRHASTTLQVGGGAAAAIIVEDVDPANIPTDEESIPEIYTSTLSTRQIVMVVQPLLTRQMRGVAEESNDSVFQIDGEEENYWLVNGQIQPNIVDVSPTEWTRLRIVYAAWSNEHLQIQIPGCELQLIAKDGVYLPTIPRQIEETNVPAGGRADIMVQCPDPVRTYPILQRNPFNDGNGQFVTIANIITTSSSSEEGDAGDDLSPPVLPTFGVTYPDYLQDLRDQPVEPGCSCTTIVGGRGGRGGRGINGFAFSEDHTTHFYKIGEIAERTIRADNHPYHQHVYPFQIQSGFSSSDTSDDGNYVQVGDWHDTIEGPGTGVIRYKPQRFDGKIMLHCHRLDHEDEGMMGIERHADECLCGEVRDDENDGLETWAVALISVGAALIVGIAVGWIYVRRRRRANQNEQ
mmetsp:Transcript_51951/g.125252  ORF Transcript_51951/g.125252 Transcript_51951/m.125252 type:complete len:544 (+) Transcript_51951:357-1988(+)|eukprot:CAMPEP_0113468820 /NCGR_PEP_ID=MMETSP0014_2-20120614/15563_1 /TAXON_ID=2857 /ORGANISM="Nitzschia sp." /LENGTH=543 /DNA_ID=CAMNT_0000361243 /DNA_START=283 /DNA_END=1914 /DNA_ORIENTATION=+ /assembly_acc=CAM_ASM_000159